ncbi:MULTISPECIES: 2Fe-2S iron-sulfur cluster-binding protein [Nocardia]|uniref:Rhodocoxin n=1 Tax=Nocardia cerradoensis TaxID=85688 RepID=A0A231GXG5_9NOCA|nr:MULTISPECIES: 2Fe-2S iron-sulfur cluster-binding protein [Nocardia]OXR41278.1 Rhodocoxin [Nocardia cerradoensis]
MAKVVYHLPDGTTSQVDVDAGQSIMSGSVNNNLPGIVAECGGSCACATCHVFLAPEYQDLFAEPSDEESELIDYLDGATPESRLSCQLIVSDTDREIHVRVADSR